MTVRSILAGKGSAVETIEPHFSLAVAVQRMAERGVGALVVVDSKQELIGILSERDVVHELAARGPASLNKPLGEVMTRKIIVCGLADMIKTVMEWMTEGKFRHIPVIDQNRLVGIVSIGDVVKFRLEEMEREQSALRDYIQTA